MGRRICLSQETGRGGKLKESSLIVVRTIGELATGPAGLHRRAWETRGVDYYFRVILDAVVSDKR